MNEAPGGMRNAGLPALSGAEALACNAIAQRARNIPLDLGDARWLLDVLPQAGPMEWPGSGADLHYEWSGARYRLVLPSAALAQLLQPLLGDATLDGLDDVTLAQAVLEAALGDAAAAVQTLGMGAPRRLAACSPADGEPVLPDRRLLVLNLRAAQGRAALHAQLETDGRGLLLIGGMAQRRATVPSALDQGPGLPLRLRACIGCTALTRDELASLVPGDVLLLQRQTLGPDRVLWLSPDGRHGLHVQCPAPASPGTARAPTVTILSPWSTAMSTSLPSDADAGPGSDLGLDELLLPGRTDGEAIASLDELPVLLRFDLGTLSLTLGQLQALQPGQVLSLGHPLAGAVRIRVHGVLVGEGDLVEVDGQLGVSIRSLPGGAGPEELP